MNKKVWILLCVLTIFTFVGMYYYFNKGLVTEVTEDSTDVTINEKPQREQKGTETNNNPTTLPNQDAVLREVPPGQKPYPEMPLAEAHLKEVEVNWKSMLDNKQFRDKFIRIAPAFPVGPNATKLLVYTTLQTMQLNNDTSSLQNDLVSNSEEVYNISAHALQKLGEENHQEKLIIINLIEDLKINDEEKMELWLGELKKPEEKQGSQKLQTIFDLASKIHQDNPNHLAMFSLNALDFYDEDEGMRQKLLSALKGRNKNAYTIVEKELATRKSLAETKGTSNSNQVDKDVETK